MLPESEDFSYHYLENFLSSFSLFITSGNPILASIFLNLSFVLSLYLTFCPAFGVISLDLTGHEFSIRVFSFLFFLFFWEGGICLLCFYFFNFIFFSFYFFWTIVDLQCFRCTAKSVQILFYYRLLQDTEYSSLCYMVCYGVFNLPFNLRLSF